jgi:hypothetical protein
MQYVEQQLAEFKAEFGKRRKRQLLATLPILAVFAVYVFLSRTPEATVFGLPATVVLGVAFAVILAFIAFTLWNWRCPACNRYLGKGISPSFCSKCGVALQ